METVESSSLPSPADFDSLRGVVENHTRERNKLQMMLQQLNLDRTSDKEELKNLSLDLQSRSPLSESSKVFLQGREVSILLTPPFFFCLVMPPILR